jgi:hypothetical protein
LQFQVNLGKNVQETPFRQKKVSMVVHACHPNYMWEVEVGELQSRPAGKKQNPISKVTRAKRVGGVAQVW